MQVCPRGNLETISPRLLMLSLIHNLIKDRKYSLAFQHLRTNKLDINLIFDLDPKYFLENT